MAKAPNPSLDKEPAEGSREVIDRELAKQDGEQKGEGGSARGQGGEAQAGQKGGPSERT